MTVARRGEVSGFMVPCLFVAAKDDLDSYPMAIKDSAKVFTLVTLYSVCVEIEFTLWFKVIT